MKEISSDKLAYNILQLQNLIKRDPPSYYDEFFTQHQHYKSLMELFKHNPQEYNENVENLVMFLAQVSSCYKEDLKSFPDELMHILRDYATVLDPSMRLCYCKALILMRNRDVLAPLDLITLCFELLRCKDKILRKHLQIYITSDIKGLNAKHKNAKVNTVLQNFMFKMLADQNGIAAKVSLEIMMELYRRNVWKDVKTVNAIATACFSNANKVLVTAHKFFLGVDEEENESESEDDDTPTVKDVMAANKVNKRSRKRMKILKRTQQILKKSKKKKKKDVLDFSAIHLLHDPQGMAEKLLKSLQVMNERYEIKMLVMNLISRLVGVHELILLNYYSFLIRYLKPHQRDVTQILMFAAQASHEHVPPDVIGPLIKSIADNFITERNSSEVITVGINSIREICIRCPLGIEKDLLQDLVQYQRYKNKNVQMAAKSLMQLFRKINPKMLQRKFRSKPTEMIKELNPLEFGASKAKSYIPGSEFLPLNPTEGTDDEMAEDNGNENDGSWVDVSHSEDELPDCIDEDEDNEDDKNETPTQIDVKESENGNEKEAVKADSNGGEKDTVDDNSESLQQTVSEKEKAIFISHSRILSQGEFQKMKVAQLAKEVQFSKSKKRKAEEETSVLDLQRAELVLLEDIEKLHKRPKPDKETRLATAQEGREGREKFARKRKKNPLAGKTQKQNNRNKTFMMIKHKVRSKVKRSFKDKQAALRSSLLKRIKNK